MVWGGEEHGLYFEDFTDEWKGPAMNSGHTKAPRTWGYRLIRKPLRKKLGRRKEKGPQQKK